MAKIPKKPSKKKPTARKKSKSSRARKQATVGGRALRLEWRKAGELVGHPGNWRKHGESQVEAFRSLLSELGQWVGYVVLNEKTGRVLDGHMRKAAVPPEELVPCLVGEWDEAEERLILATFNPVGDLAGVDAVKASALLEGLEATLPAVGAVLEGLERRVEKALKAMGPGSSQASDGAAVGESQVEGGAGETSGGTKPVKDVRTVMVRCADELDQMTLAAKLKAAGFKCKRAELIPGSG